MKKLFLIALLAPAIALATPDTPEARRVAVGQYFKVQPMSEMMNDMQDRMMQGMPPQMRASMQAQKLSPSDIQMIEAAATDSMVKHFTIGEIEAMTAFYSSPEGRSVMKKMPDYMADLMPAIQTKMMAKMMPQQGGMGYGAGGMPQGGQYGQGGGMPQGNYPQGNYPQGNYPQGNYPQGNYPQGNFQQGYNPQMPQ